MDVIEWLSSRSIVNFQLNEDKTEINIMEACDFYYNIDLSKEEFKKLIDELNSIYQEME